MAAASPPANAVARRLWLGAAVTLAAALLAPRLADNLSTDLFDLLPRGEPAVDAMRETAQTFGSADRELMVVAWPALAAADPEEQRARAGEIIDALAARLRDSPEVASVAGDLHHSEAFFKGLGPAYFSLLPAEKLTEFRARISPEGMREALRTGRALLNAPAGPLAAEYFRQDPLGLASLAFADQPLPGKTRADAVNGLLLSPDGRHALLLVRGARPLTDLSAARATGDALDAAIDASRLDAGLAPAEGFTISRAGGYSIAARDAAMIRHDAASGSLLTTVLVLLVIGCVTRSARVPFLLLLPLFAATLWLIALLALSPLRLGSAAAGSAGILLGLGSDLAIVLYARMLARLQAGDSVVAAAARARREGRGALWLCALTTAATFGALALTRFPVLRQMGILVAGGILLSALAIDGLLPELLIRFAPAGGYPPMRQLPIARIAGVSSKKIRPAAWLLGAIAAAIFCLLAVRRADFDLAAMHRASNPAVGEFEGLLDTFGLPRESQIVVLRGDSPDDLAAKCGLLWRSGLAAQSTGFCRWVRGTQEVSAPELVDAAPRFRQALMAGGFNPEAFAAPLQLLADLPAAARGLSGHAFIDNPMLGEFVSPPAAGDSRWQAQLLFPETTPLRSDSLPVGSSLSSIPAMNDALLRMGRKDMILAFASGMLALALLVGLAARNFGQGLWVMAIYPVSLSLLLPPLLAGWFKVDMLAVAGVLVLAGVVSDYAIQWLATLPAAGSAEDPRLRSAVASALALDALTTLIAFISLLAARYTGLHSLGWVAGLGSFAGCLYALLGPWSSRAGPPSARAPRALCPRIIMRWRR